MTHMPENCKVTSTNRSYHGAKDVHHVGGDLQPRMVVEGLGRVQHDRDEGEEGEAAEAPPGEGPVRPDDLVRVGHRLVVGAVVREGRGVLRAAARDGLLPLQHDGVL